MSCVDGVSVMIAIVRRSQYLSDRILRLFVWLLSCTMPSLFPYTGLAMLWERDLSVELKSYTRYHIDAVVTDPTSGFKWRITGFYGNPDTNRRKESWELLHFLNAQF